MKSKLVQLLVRQFQYDRCKGWHNTRNTGQLLNIFLHLIEDWTNAGFPSEAFKDSSFQSITSNQTRITPNVQDLIFAFRDMLEYIGSKERDRLLNIDDFLLDFDVAIADPILVGGPEALDILVCLIERLLDFWYLAVHGDYAFKIGKWLDSLTPKPFGFTLHDDNLRLLWDWTCGKELVNKIETRKKRVKVWLDDKPHAKKPSWPPPPPHVRRMDYTGYRVNRFVEKRLLLIRELIGKQIGRSIWLNAGAYPRGGRKPPSVTHGTTYGIDLDIERIHSSSFLLGTNVQSLGYLGKSAESKALGEIKKDIPKFVESLKQKNTSPGAWSLYATDDFLPAVILTQAILLTFPSRMYYGDFVVISTAIGGINQKFNELNYPIPLSNVHINFEPVAHHNHWHIDWLPKTVLQHKTEVAKHALFKVGWQKSCSLEAWCRGQKRNKLLPQECRRQRESRPIKHKNQLQRPIYIGGPKRVALDYAEVEKILKEGLKYDTDTVEFPLGDGDIENEDNIINWLTKFLQTNEDVEPWIH